MTMKKLSTPLRFALLAWVTPISLCAYEVLQGPTQLLYWDKTNGYAGYTFFGVRVP